MAKEQEWKLNFDAARNVLLNELEWLTIKQIDQLIKEETRKLKQKTKK